MVIFGSCVSRDAFEYDDSHEFRIVEYFARSSIGSAFAHNGPGQINLESLRSQFQRRVVEFDLLKTFPQFLVDADFDILV